VLHTTGIARGKADTHHESDAPRESIPKILLLCFLKAYYAGGVGLRGVKFVVRGLLHHLDWGGFLQLVRHDGGSAWEVWTLWIKGEGRTGLRDA
jgi:hypothetical protein